jgi:hypothetical protein
MSGGRMNWSRFNSRARIRRRGSEGSKGGACPPLAVWERRPRLIVAPPTKAELRREAAKAFMAWRAKRGLS